MREIKYTKKEFEIVGRKLASLWKEEYSSYELDKPRRILKVNCTKCIIEIKLDLMKYYL